MLYGGELQVDAKNSNFDIYKSTLYMKSWNMPLIGFWPQIIPQQDCIDFKNWKLQFFLKTGPFWPLIMIHMQSEKNNPFFAFLWSHMCTHCKFDCRPSPHLLYINLTKPQFWPQFEVKWTFFADLLGLKKRCFFVLFRPTQNIGKLGSAFFFFFFKLFSSLV